MDQYHHDMVGLSLQGVALQSFVIQIVHEWQHINATWYQQLNSIHIVQTYYLVTRSRIRSLMQADSSRIRWGASKRQSITDFLFWMGILNIIEALEQSDQDVSRFSKSKLLTDADSRSTIERNVVPANLSVRPAVGVEAVGIFTPDILAALQSMSAVHDRLALADVDGLKAVRAATTWDRRVFDG